MRRLLESVIICINYANRYLILGAYRSALGIIEKKTLPIEQVKRVFLFGTAIAAESRGGLSGAD